MARKRKKRRRSRGLLAIAAIALLIAGFVARRVMVPQLMHALTYRPPEHPQQAARDDSGSGGDNASAPVASNHRDDKSTNANASPAPSDERITEHDRRALDDLVKEKSH